MIVGLMIPLLCHPHIPLWNAWDWISQWCHKKWLVSHHPFSVVNQCHKTTIFFGWFTKNVNIPRITKWWWLGDDLWHCVTATFKSSTVHFVCPLWIPHFIAATADELVMDGESDGYQRFASSRVCAKSKFSGSIYIYVYLYNLYIIYTHRWSGSEVFLLRTWLKRVGTCVKKPALGGDLDQH